MPAVLRRTLLAVVCCLALCAAFVYLASAPADAAPRVTASAQPDGPGTGGSAPQWHAQDHATASLTESPWKFRQAHEVPAFSDDVPAAAAPPARHAVPRLSHASHHLLHVPLLI